LSLHHFIATFPVSPHSYFEITPRLNHPARALSSAVENRFALDKINLCAPRGRCL
jgi:hypothetical protein